MRTRPRTNSLEKLLNHNNLPPRTTQNNASLKKSIISPARTQPSKKLSSPPPSKLDKSKNELSQNHFDDQKIRFGTIKKNVYVSFLFLAL